MSLSVLPFFSDECMCLCASSVLTHVRLHVAA